MTTSKCLRMQTLIQSGFAKQNPHNQKKHENIPAEGNLQKGGRRRLPLL